MSAIPDGELACRLPEDSRVKVVGLGGVGCVVLEYLGVFLKGLGRPVRLVLIDGDHFEPGNSRRMVFSTMGNKAEVKATEVLGWLGPSDVAVAAVGEYVTPANIANLIRPGDHVF